MSVFENSEWGYRFDYKNNWWYIDQKNSKWLRVYNSRDCTTGHCISILQMRKDESKYNIDEECYYDTDFSEHYNLQEAKELCNFINENINDLPDAV